MQGSVSQEKQTGGEVVEVEPKPNTEIEQEAKKSENLINKTPLKSVISVNPMETIAPKPEIKNTKTELDKKPSLQAQYENITSLSDVKAPSPIELHIPQIPKMVKKSDSPINPFKPPPDPFKIFEPPPNQSKLEDTRKTEEVSNPEAKKQEIPENNNNNDNNNNNNNNKPSNNTEQTKNTPSIDDIIIDATPPAKKVYDDKAIIKKAFNAAKEGRFLRLQEKEEENKANKNESSSDHSSSDEETQEINTLNYTVHTLADNKIRDSPITVPIPIVEKHEDKNAGLN